MIANQNEMLANKRDGMRMVVYSIVLAALVILVSTGLALIIGSELAQMVLNPVLTIILWVIIWQPVEMLFFESRHLRHMNYVWKKIIEMPFEFKPSPAPANGIGAIGITVD